MSKCNQVTKGNWTNPKQPQCYKKDPAEFATESSCEEACKAATMSKCNQVTKQCEPCQEGDAGCNTMEYCQASCNIPHAKCNTTTKQCLSCDPAKDSNCTQSAGECGGACANSPDMMSCDTQTGKCTPCQQGEKGCTPFAAHTGQAQCDAACKKPVYAKCDFTKNQCAECDPVADKDCMQTKEWCDAAQAAGKCKARSATPSRTRTACRRRSGATPRRPLASARRRRCRSLPACGAVTRSRRPTRAGSS